MKKAYAVIVYEDINDDEKLKAYMAITPKLLAKWGAKFLSRGYPVSLKENAKNERTIIVEFSSVEKAEEFYDSPEYKVALDALEGVVRQSLTGIKAPRLHKSMKRRFETTL